MYTEESFAFRALHLRFSSRNMHDAGTEYRMVQIIDIPPPDVDDDEDDHRSNDSNDLLNWEGNNLV